MLPDCTRNKSKTCREARWNSSRYTHIFSPIHFGAQRSRKRCWKEDGKQPGNEDQKLNFFFFFQKPASTTKKQRKKERKKEEFRET